MADLAQQIEDVATGPASFTAGERSATAQDPLKVIEADKYLKSLDAAAQARSGGNFLGRSLRRARAIPPSALGS